MHNTLSTKAITLLFAGIKPGYAGCMLPVEMFFPRKEFPTPQLESALASLGVTCRQLPDVGSASQKGGELDESEPLFGLSGFTLKIAALILSQFSEVIATGFKNPYITRLKGQCRDLHISVQTASNPSTQMNK